MQVQRIQYNNINFKGNIVESGALKKFQAGLNNSEKAKFNSYVNIIKNSKDKCNYIFDYVQIGNESKGRRIATISLQNKNKTIQHPPILSDKDTNALKLFKKLAENYTKII